MSNHWEKMKKEKIMCCRHIFIFWSLKYYVYSSLWLSMTPHSKSMICQVWKIGISRLSKCSMTCTNPVTVNKLLTKEKWLFLAWLFCSESIHVCKAHMCQHFTNIRQLRLRILSVVYMYLDLRAIIYSTLPLNQLKIIYKRKKFRNRLFCWLYFNDKKGVMVLIIGFEQKEQNQWC